jgi:hypothetical protein
MQGSLLIETWRRSRAASAVLLSVDEAICPCLAMDETCSHGSAIGHAASSSSTIDHVIAL